MSARQTHTYSITLHFQLLSKAKSPHSELGFALSILTTLTTLSATQAALVTTTLALLWLSSRWAFVRCTPVDGKKKFEAATHAQPVCVCLCICVRVRVYVLIYEK